jgi:hypothetical protein
MLKRIGMAICLVSVVENIAFFGEKRPQIKLRATKQRPIKPVRTGGLCSACFLAPKTGFSRCRFVAQRFIAGRSWCAARQCFQLLSLNFGMRNPCVPFTSHHAGSSAGTPGPIIFVHLTALIVCDLGEWLNLFTRAPARLHFPAITTQPLN